MPLLYSPDGAVLLGWCDEPPICGVDFCDRCSDCLACYANWDESHFCQGVVYLDGLAEWMEAHNLDTNPFRMTG